MPKSDSSVAALGAIVAGALIFQVANTIMNTVVPIWMARAGAAPLLIGAVGAAYSVGYLVGCFAIPGLIRRIGHIRGFAVFASLQAASAATFPLMPEGWWLMPRLAMGLCGAALGICIESWISGHARGSKRGRIFAVYQILNRLALIFSQIGLGFVALQSQSIFLVASMVFSLALVPVGLTHAHGPETGPVVSVKLRTLWQQAPAGVVGCLYVGLMGGPLTAVTPAYGVIIGLDQRGTILLAAAVQIGALLLQWPVGLLADRLASRFIMLAGTALSALAAGSLAAAAASGMPLPLPVVAVVFAVVGGCSLSLYAVAVTHAYLRLGPELAVGLSARLLFLWAFGSSIGPLAATAFMQALGPQGFLLYIVLLSVAVAAYVALRISRKPSPPLAEGERGGLAPVLPEVRSDKH